MKTVLILTCALFLGVLNSVKAGTVTAAMLQSPAGINVNALNSTQEDEDSYLPSSGSRADDFSVDKKKKKKKQKKSHAS